MSTEEVDLLQVLDSKDHTDLQVNTETHTFDLEVLITRALDGTTRESACKEHVRRSSTALVAFPAQHSQEKAEACTDRRSSTMIEL